MFQSKKSAKKKRKKKAKKDSAVLCETPSSAIGKTSASITSATNCATTTVVRDDVDMVLKKITAVQSTNCEIIERVESVENVQTYGYKLEMSENFVISIKETVHVQKVMSLIGNSEYQRKIVNGVGDFFTGQLPQLRLKSWQDLKSLNDEISSVVSAVDTKSDQGKEVLLRILDTLEVLQTVFGEAEERIISLPSKLQSLDALVHQVNSTLNEISLEGVSMGRPRMLDFANSQLINQMSIDALVKWYGSGWRLSYSAARDGWDAAKYHQMCDGKGSTITIIRTEKRIFGFFLSKTVSSEAYHETDPNASIFVLSHPQISEMRKWPKTAIRCSTDASKYGPYLSKDYYVVSHASTNRNSLFSYVDVGNDIYYLGGPGSYFTPTGLEVYIR